MRLPLLLLWTRRRRMGPAHLWLKRDLGRIQRYQALNEVSAGSLALAGIAVSKEPTQGWNCRALGVEPPVHVYKGPFWMKLGFKFQNLGKISKISTSDPPPQFF